MYNHQLETFLRVADAGSFNKAAEESYYFGGFSLGFYTAAGRIAAETAVAELGL